MNHRLVERRRGDDGREVDRPLTREVSQSEAIRARIASDFNVLHALGLAMAATNRDPRVTGYVVQEDPDQVDRAIALGRLVRSNRMVRAGGSR